MHSPEKAVPPVKTTHELSETLQSTDNHTSLKEYLISLPAQSGWSGFSEYFCSLPAVRAIPAADLIRRAGLDRTYGYQILNGTRNNPGKDKILRLAMAAGLSLAETQRALKIAGVPILYARNRRDAILIFSIRKGLNVIDTNELLDQFDEESLE